MANIITFLEILFSVFFFKCYKGIDVQNEPMCEKMGTFGCSEENRIIEFAAAWYCRRCGGCYSVEEPCSKHSIPHYKEEKCRGNDDCNISALRCHSELGVFTYLKEWFTCIERNQTQKPICHILMKLYIGNQVMQVTSIKSYSDGKCDDEGAPMISCEDHFVADTTTFLLQSCKRFCAYRFLRCRSVGGYYSKTVIEYGFQMSGDLSHPSTKRSTASLITDGATHIAENWSTIAAFPQNNESHYGSELWYPSTKNKTSSLTTGETTKGIPDNSSASAEFWSSDESRNGPIIGGVIGGVSMIIVSAILVVVVTKMRTRRHRDERKTSVKRDVISNSTGGPRANGNVYEQPLSIYSQAKQTTGKSNGTCVPSDYETCFVPETAEKSEYSLVGAPLEDGSTSLNVCDSVNLVDDRNGKKYVAESPNNGQSNNYFVLEKDEVWKHTTHKTPTICQPTGTGGNMIPKNYILAEACDSYVLANNTEYSVPFRECDAGSTGDQCSAANKYITQGSMSCQRDLRVNQDMYGYSHMADIERQQANTNDSTYDHALCSESNVDHYGYALGLNILKGSVSSYRKTNDCIDGDYSVHVDPSDVEYNTLASV